MRANQKPKRRAVLTGLVTLLSGSLLAIIPSSPAHADQACQPGGVYILWARGSGQGFDGAQDTGFVEGTAFKATVLNALNATMPGVPRAWAELGNLDGDFRLEPNNPDYEYPAVPVNNDWNWVNLLNAGYTISVSRGAFELVRHLNHRYSLGPLGQGCMSEVVVLAGYSQGAHAILEALGRTGGDSTWSLNQEAKDRIAFVAAYGDPLSNTPSCLTLWRRGDGGCVNQGALGSRTPYVTQEFESRVGHWCADGDGLCHGSPWGGTHTTAYRNTWIWQSAAEIAAAAKYHAQKLAGINPSLIAVRNGNSVLAKAGLSDPWIAQNITPATDLKVADGRIGYTDTAGQLRIKEGLYGNWVNVYGPATEYTMSSSLLIIRDGTNLHLKVGALNSGWIWSFNATPATAVRVVGNRITYTDTNGQLWARDGLGGVWVNVYGPVTRYAASNSLLVIQLGQNIFGKAGLTDAWVQLNPSPVGNDLRISGNRITWTDTGGNKYAKDGLNGPWVSLGLADDYTATESLFIVRGGTGIHGKQGSLTSSWVWSFNATPVMYVWAMRDRIGYVQTNGSLWAKDGLTGPWVNVYGSVNQAWIS